MNASVPVRTFQSTTPASRREWQLAIFVVAVSLAAFVAIVPYVRTPLAQVPSFIPSYESALFVNDLITAALLFSQFIQLRARALLVLAGGYLFGASFIIPHVLTFPGAFSPTGLLGAGTQTTAWLYTFWHGGFPLFVLAYAFVRARDLPAESADGSAAWPIAASFVLVTLLMGMARERRFIQQQLVQAQKMEAVGQLTGGIAHDFNNMLGAVIGNLDLAIDGVKDRPEVEALLNDALEGALRGAELVKRLLAFSRKQPLQLQTVDLSHMMEKLRPLLCSAIGERVALNVVVRADTLWPVRVDPIQLESAILNLCINARDAMPEGGRITIEMSNLELESWFAPEYPDLAVGRYVGLSVTDTGVGIPANIVARVFEPFFTTKEAGKGSGLGLSMVYGYMKQSGGSIKIYSETGMGTTVSLHFPIGAQGAGRDTVPMSSQAPTSHGNERVLIVEDSPQIRKIAVRIIRALGYEIEEAADAETALSMLQRMHCDLVFSDVVLPGMSGIALAGEMQRLYPETPIILTSGFSSRIAAGDLCALGADFIGKPYRQASLAAALRKALDPPRKAA